MLQGELVHKLAGAWVLGGGGGHADAEGAQGAVDIELERIFALCATEKIVSDRQVISAEDWLRACRRSRRWTHSDRQTGWPSASQGCPAERETAWASW